MENYLVLRVLGDQEPTASEEMSYNVMTLDICSTSSKRWSNHNRLVKLDR